MRFKKIIVCLLAFILSSPRAGAQIQPLSYAAFGVATSVALDNAEKKAEDLINQAGAVASLTSSKIARDLQMLISDARQQMHEELADNWDKLDVQKVDLLRSIDGYIQKLNGLMVKGGLLEEDAYLDISQIAQRLPFADSDPILRSVRGSTITYRDTGMYRVNLKGTIFDPSNGAFTIKVSNSPVSADVKIAFSPPYDASIDFPALYLKPFFKDTALSYVPVEISVRVPDKSYYFYKLRKKTRTAPYVFTLQLLPKHPVTKYSLIEMNAEPTVDKNNVQTKWGETVTVRSCGSHGCNSSQPICADVPVGAEPIGVVLTEDSLGNAWGEFNPNSVTIAAGTICEWFHQHRPDDRNVRIKVSYYPPDSTLVANDVQFHEVSVEDSAAKPVAPATELAFDRLYVAYFNKKMQSFRLAMILFTGEPLGSTPEKTSSPLLEVSKLDLSKDREITVQLKEPWGQ
jgi:hypothetical protein